VEDRTADARDDASEAAQKAKSAFFEQLAKEHPALAEECEHSGIPLEKVGHYWHKGQHFSIFTKTGYTLGGFLADIEQAVGKYAPTKWPEIRYTTPTRPGLLVLDPADLHIGKIGDPWEVGEAEAHNSQLIIDRVLSGITDILEEAVQCRDLEKIILVLGNDILHRDTPVSATTKGTHVDQSEMWHRSYMLAEQMYMDAADFLLQIAPVHLIHTPSNHDLLSGFALARTIASYYRHNPNVTVDATPAHRKYAIYGNTLMGFTHGDGANPKDLPDLMKSECRTAWHKATWGKWFCHHLHHKDARRQRGKSRQEDTLIEKDYGDVAVLSTGIHHQTNRDVHVEYVRSPGGADSWHHKKGLVGSPKAIEGYIFDPQQGEKHRITSHF
jgi:hypothetical protein